MNQELRADRRSPPPVRVVAGIVIEGNRVLVAQRPEPQSFALKWEFPGGKVEPEESAETALDREFREELGMGVEILRPYGEIRYRDGSGRDLEVRFFLARRVGGRPRPVEVAAVKWVDTEALTRVDFIPANKTIVNRLVLDIRAGRVGEAD